jgi:cell division protein FtsW
MKFWSFARTEKNPITAWWWTVDRALLAAVFVLMGTGVALVMSASPPVAERIGVSSLHFVIRHLIVLGPAIALMIGISFLSERQIWRAATFMLAASMAAMVLVLFIGAEIKGAQRWINLPGFSLQPSEFAKPGFALFSAWLMARQKENNAFPGNIIAAGIYFILISLLLLQPDLGMTMVLSMMFAAQICLAGLPLRYFFGFMAVGAMGLVLCYFALDHVQSRINRFLDPASGDNYQIERSIDAFKNGGLLGTGAGQGTMKTKIPDAHADFIFSVGAEEMGFFFVLSLLALYGFIIWRVLAHIMTSGNLFIILACGGLITLFGLQTIVHIGSALHLLPTKGMTLPFISYGGSSLLAMAFAFGVILALTRRTVRPSIFRMGMSRTSDTSVYGAPTP